MKIDIDLNDEIKLEIQKQVDRELSQGGILPYIKRAISSEIRKKFEGDNFTTKRLNGIVVGIKKTLECHKKQLQVLSEK